MLFSPAPIGHLMGTVVHAHQCPLVIDARDQYDNGHVSDDEIQVVFGEVKVDCLKSKFGVVLSKAEFTLRLPSSHS